MSYRRKGLPLYPNESSLFDLEWGGFTPPMDVSTLLYESGMSLEMTPLIIP
jgi:hypothetical protein